MELARDAERSSGAAQSNPYESESDSYESESDPYVSQSTRRAAESAQVRLRKGAAKATKLIVTGGLELPPGL